VVHNDEHEEAANGAEEGIIVKDPVQVTAEDLADEEWGPIKGKAKKQKGEKGKKVTQQEPSDG
jgi:translation initiation factor 5B